MEFGRANGRSVTPVNGSVSPMRKKARGGDGHHGEIPIEISTSMCSSSQNNGQNGFPCIPSASRSGALYVQSHPQSFPRVPSASRGATPTPSDFSQRSPSVDRRVDLDSCSNPVCGRNSNQNTGGRVDLDSGSNPACGRNRALPQSVLEIPPGIHSSQLTEPAATLPTAAPHSSSASTNNPIIKTCYMCLFAEEAVCAQYTTFIMNETARSSRNQIARQVSGDIIANDLQAGRDPAEGASVADIERHIALHMLSPSVKVPELIRELDDVRRLMHASITNTCPETGAAVVDTGNVALYLRVVREQIQVYKMGDIAKLSLATAGVAASVATDL
jgi:hypothetical protein